MSERRLTSEELVDLRGQYQRGADNPTYKPRCMLIPRGQVKAMLDEIAAYRVSGQGPLAFLEAELRRRLEGESQ